MITSLNIIIIIMGSLFASIGMIFFKKFSNQLKFLKKKINIIFNKNLILGLISYIIATVLIIFVLKSNELSKIYPITSMNYIFVIILSWFFLKEKITFNKLFGTFFIIVGIIVLVY
ncbi:EamA family transporter [Candidatus Woesearchaeota archaeon]|nr:EamA family transporter [Candidatus Woesearchaeota archaeon]MCF8013491.1 EamA family transporter [Candidatus Woesearchaeota archaeon]